MPRARTRWPLPPGLAAAFAFLLAMAGVGLFLSVRLANDSERTAQLQIYGRAIADVVTNLRDAETGQRGYLLTRDPAYLQPYDDAGRKVEPALAQVRATERANGRDVYHALAPPVTAKIAELRETVRLAKAGRYDLAIARVRRGDGLANMGVARTILNQERAFVRDRTLAIINGSILLSRQLAVGLLLGVLATIALTFSSIRQQGLQLRETRHAQVEAEGALAALRDQTTAREEAEGQVRQLQKMESLGQLTGGIAHDFNNMLAVVLGNLELARRRLRSDPARAEAGIDHASEGARRAAALTARLLAFSRRQPLAPVPLDAGKLVAGMSELLNRTLGDNIRIETVLGAGLWRCYADAGELENAVLNLAVNARDAMPDGGRLTIETGNGHIDEDYARGRGDVQAGQYVTISVTDTGEGMAPDVVARAFDPFFTTKGVGKGTGLGLSQVFGFAKQSGGHVAIYSEVGRGTTVKLYLPRFAGVEVAAAPAAPSEELPEGRASEIILLVEDEGRVRQFAVDVLRELGYTTISAPGPKEALALLADQPAVALLFTDIVMPDMDGRRLADLARAERPDLKVLFTTGYTRNAVVHNGMLDIGVAFLPKPYTIAALARKVRDTIDGQGVNRQV